MHIALGADVASLRSTPGADTAVLAISLLFRDHRIMLSGQRNRSIRTSACLHCLPIGSEQLHQGAHELFSEVELLGSVRADRPQLEGIDDAHVDEPPCEARPGLLALPPDEVGVV